MWIEVTFLGAYPSGYTYFVPPPWEKRVCAGTMVVVPLRKRRITGIVTQILSTLPAGVLPQSVKPVLSVPFDTPIFSIDLLRFYKWCAQYYQAPLGSILKASLPLPRGILKGETCYVTPEGKMALSKTQKRRGTDREPPWEASGLLSDLPRLISQEENWEDLLSWTGQGWITWHYPEFSKAFAPKVSFYRLSPSVPEGIRTGPKERAILDFIARLGKAQASEVRTRFPNARASINRLLEKGAIQVTFQDEPLTLPPGFESDVPIPPTLSPEQKVVLGTFEKEMSAETPRPILLHGVTGGGKTELYIQAIQKTILAGKSSLVLVPEIVLTPQLIARIRGRCPAPIAIWHSRLAEKERWRQWLLIRRENPTVIIGARSAIFMPVEKLGLIIIDEEHDPSFKQEEGLLYHARDVAIVRGRLTRCALILGSATPSIESYHNVRRGRFRYSTITRRPTGQPLPAVEVIDLRKEGVSPRQVTRGLMLTRPLREALMEASETGQQSLLFLNRRGYARFLICRQCGETLTCPRCSVSLILHKPKLILRCHYCGYSRPLPPTCERCGGDLAQMGGGTQRLEEEIREILPNARVARLDRDTAQKHSGYETLLTRLRQREIDVLIGTQMIVKGHDFPGVVLMGVVMADHALKFPDFRAAERTFQLLTQASGRCGRGNRPGRVIIQTFTPEHYSIQYAARHDFIGFYNEEIRYRKESGYPPFTRMAVIRITGPDLEAVTTRAARLAAEGKRLLRRSGIPMILLGPAPALLSRLKNRYRWQLILKSKTSGDLHRLIGEMLRSRFARPEKFIKIRVEFDPVQLV